MKKILVFVALVFCCQFSLAASWSGKIVELRSVNGSNVVLFKLSEALESAARCNEFGMYAVSLSSPGGQVHFELLKLAYMQDHHIEAESLNTCSVHWKSESVKDIQIRP